MCPQLVFEANLRGEFKSAIVGMDDVLIANGSCCPMINTPEDTAKGIYLPEAYSQKNWSGVCTRLPKNCTPFYDQNLRFSPIYDRYGWYSYPFALAQTYIAHSTRSIPVYLLLCMFFSFCSSTSKPISFQCLNFIHSHSQNNKLEDRLHHYIQGNWWSTNNAVDLVVSKISPSLFVFYKWLCGV